MATASAALVDLLSPDNEYVGFWQRTWRPQGIATTIYACCLFCSYGRYAKISCAPVRRLTRARTSHLSALRQDRYDFPSISKSEHKALSRARPAEINIARR